MLGYTDDGRIRFKCKKYSTTTSNFCENRLYIDVCLLNRKISNNLQHTGKHCTGELIMEWTKYIIHKNEIEWNGLSI